MTSLCTYQIQRSCGALLLLGVLFIGLSPTANAATGEDIAVTYTLPTAVVWEPQIEYISVTLNVSAPDGTVSTQVFTGNDEPAYLAAGHVDGSYTYELRFQTVAPTGKRDDSGTDGLAPTVSSPVASAGSRLHQAVSWMAQYPLPAIPIVRSPPRIRYSLTT